MMMMMMMMMMQTEINKAVTSGVVLGAKTTPLRNKM